MRGTPYLEDKPDSFFLETVGRAKNLTEHSILAGQQLGRRVDRNSFRGQMYKRGILEEVRGSYEQNSISLAPGPSEIVEPRDSRRSEKPLSDRLYSVLRKRTNASGKTVEELADELDVSPRKVREAAKELSDSGKYLHRSGSLVSVHVPKGEPEEETKTVLDINGAERFFVGVVSDTHFGSKVQQPTALRNFMEEATELYDPECWLHVGDLLDGMGVYRGHAAEVWLTDFDEQVEYAAATYPKTDKNTLLLGGNHDEAFLKLAGADPLTAFCKLRPDVESLGWRGARVEVGGVSFYMWHPGGGLSYAVSYKLQKRIEGFGGGVEPDILLSGHFHVGCYVRHRGVHGFLVPSWQGQTAYVTSLGYESAIGGYVLECVLDDEGRLTELTPHMSRLSKPLLHDYPRW